MSTDRDAIIDLMTLYAWQTDSKSYETFERVFAPDVECSYEGFSEPIVGLDAIREFAHRALDGLDATQHLFSNFAIEIDGDSAQFRMSAQASHFKNDAPGGPLYVVAATYYITVARTPAGWRITRLRCTPVFTSGNPAVLAELAA
jgi:hypothetical protein